MFLQAVPEIEIIEETETDLEPLYRVIIYNDDVTPMDFVVHVLKTIFFLGNDKAAEIMLTAHINGKAKPKIESIRHTLLLALKIILCIFLWNLNESNRKTY